MIGEIERSMAELKAGNEVLKDQKIKLLRRAK